MTSFSSLQRFEAALKGECSAEIYFDRGMRGLYSTDASLYQIEPLGVVVPRTVNDVLVAMRLAASERLPILPRGAATSLSGQTVGRAIVFDFSKYLNRIGIVDRDRMIVRVEPGVVLDRLNAHLKPLGLMYAPDVSTSDRATIGGMVGNNSAGARSLKYGKTVDHIDSLEVALAEGTPQQFGPVDHDELERLCAQSDRIGAIYRTVRETVANTRPAIEAKFPKILRRVSGYNLDELVPGIAVRPQCWKAEPWKLNLARLIVGSEGTLAIVTAAHLKLVPLPPAQGLVVLSFATIPAALERIEEMVATGPVAVEMLDRMILDLAARNPDTARHLNFTEGRPAAVLAAQYYADSADELAQRADDLARRFEGKPEVLGVRKSLTASAKDDFWTIRKAGLSLLMGMVGDAKPVAFVEDTAVDPKRLPEFYDRFQKIVAAHGTSAACYGHADVGCLHIRPILNVKTSAGVDSVRSIARQVAELVAEFGGAMSGEHGDGLARSRWNERLFGPEVYAAFRAVKRAFDPDNRLNPGKVVGSPDLTADFRLSPAYHADEPAITGFDFSGQGGFARAIEMCSGVGACRKTGSGTMCPSYMVTMDEEHTTRGRANALRLAISGQLADGLRNETLRDALDLCLQCKACKTECPSNVDMARLKSEWLHQKYLGQAPPFGSLLMAYVYRLNALGSATAPLANWSLRQPPVRWLLEKVASIDRRRVLPAFAWTTFRSWFKRHQPDPRAGKRGKVVLLDECITNNNDPEVGQAAVRVLEVAGYKVELAGIACCGRPAVSKGLLDLGRDLAEDNVARLAAHATSGVRIVGCEPSCVTMFVDEYQDFRLGEDARTVAAQTMMIDAFLADRTLVPELPLRPADKKILLHGHCQQKALFGTAATAAMLGRIPELKVQTLDSGCCGMAGSFGYELGHYDVSSALANRVLLPAVAANPDATLIAPGFSCRHQVEGLAGVEAMHPVQLVAEQLLGAGN
jgi:FAD/FMN-containing dehydrogenase/Fe-S oxidoreductase